MVTEARLISPLSTSERYTSTSRRQANNV
jgi:hypothetical protein